MHLYSAVIEHTNKVIFLEDDDVAAVTADGGKSYYCIIINFSITKGS